MIINQSIPIYADDGLVTSMQKIFEVWSVEDGISFTKLSSK